jgi:hypothetical protein
VNEDKDHKPKGDPNDCPVNAGVHEIGFIEEFMPTNLDYLQDAAHPGACTAPSYALHEAAAGDLSGGIGLAGSLGAPQGTARSTVCVDPER